MNCLLRMDDGDCKRILALCMSKQASLGFILFNLAASRTSLNPISTVPGTQLRMADRSQDRRESYTGIEQPETYHEVNVSKVEQPAPATAPIIRIDSYSDDRHVNLTWRSWMVVL